MLATLCAASRFQSIAASNREDISKQWDFGSWPPRLLSRLVSEQKWRKNFQNVIYTHVCSSRRWPHSPVFCTDTCPIGQKTEGPDSSLNQPYFFQVKTDDNA